MNRPDQHRDAVEPLWVTVEEAAAMFRLSVSKWKEMVKNGRAPKPVKVDKLSRWYVPTLREWGEEKAAQGFVEEGEAA